MNQHQIILVMAFFLAITYSKGQTNDSESNPEKKNLVFDLNEDGSHFVRATFLNQVWMRYTANNPGTTVDGFRKPQTYDIGLRRTRIQLFGQLSDRVFFYTQFGQNNLAYNSPRKQGLFFLDAVAELKVIDKYFSMGSGLTGWNGVSRYAAPSVGSILSLDAPLYQQGTNDINDQFLRKLSIYAKGKIGNLDYRLIVSDPMSLSKSVAQTAAISNNSKFSYEPGNAQFHGYFKYEFLDNESNLTPFSTGAYLGKKSVFNIGAGFMFQQNAMWNLTNNGLDTARSNLLLLAVDVFYDAPINKEKGNAITVYATFSSNDYGKNYVRNVGVMNPANGTNATGTFNGKGNNFPLIGTGSTVYAQLGYLFKKNMLGKLGTIQPYIASQYSKFDLLKTPMLMYETGINWLIDGHRSKISLNYQNRPIFNSNVAGDIVETTRRGMLVMQYQISL